MIKKFKRTISIVFLFSLMATPILILSFVQKHVLSLNRENIYFAEPEYENIRISNGSPRSIRVGAYHPFTFDPVDSLDLASNTVLDQVLETLFAFNLSDIELPRINRLAQSYRWINTTSLQIRLREEVLFHDGTPFNASAAKWNLDRLLYLTNCSGTNTGTIAHTRPLWLLPDGKTPIIANVDTVGDWNITIALNAPYAPLLSLLSSNNAAMLSPTTHANKTNNLLTLSDIPIGTGPFKLVNYLTDVEVNFIRWDSYWRTPAFFEEMRFIIFRHDTDALDAMLKHEIDYLSNRYYSPDYSFSYESDTNITLKRFTDDTGKPDLSYLYLEFNNHKYNSSWRKAFSYAFNYSYVIEELREGEGKRAYTAISPGFGDSYNTSLPSVAIPDDGDLNIARQTMVDMGFGDMGWTDSQWISIAEGDTPFLTVDYHYNYENVFKEDLGIAISDWLKLIGVKTNLIGVSFATFLNYIFFDPDTLGIFFYSYAGVDYLDPYHILSWLFSPLSDYNYAQVNDTTLNSFMASALSELNDSAREDIYKDIQWYIATEGFFHAPLYHSKVYTVHLTGLEDVPYNCMYSFYAYPIYRTLPGSFLLNSTAEDPEYDGNFALNWTVASQANNYSVYQYSNYITEINGSLNLLASEITDLSLQLSGFDPGVYYFIVVASNDYGNILSRCIQIIVEEPPPGLFSLSSTSGEPDYDGNFFLNWTAASEANNYSVYDYSNYITEINGSLNLIANEITDLSLQLGGYDIGTYYFIVVALNVHGETLSNCISIDVEPIKTLEVTIPSTSNQWEIGSVQSINWISTGTISNVKLELYMSDTFIIEITPNTPNDGHFLWSVFSGLIASSNYRIKIIDVSNSSVFEYSNYFEIVTPPQNPPNISGYEMTFLLGVVAIVVFYLSKKKIS